MKETFSILKSIWKAWIGTILLAAGLTSSLKHNNYWMLLIALLGSALIYFGWEKVNQSAKHRSIFNVTFITILTVSILDFFGV